MASQVKKYYILNILDTNQLIVTPRSWIRPRVGGTVLVFLPLSCQDHDLLAMHGGPHCRSWDEKYAKIVRGYDTYVEAKCFLNQLNTRILKHKAVRNPFEKPDQEPTPEINGNDNQSKTQLEILLTSKSSLETLLTTPQPPAKPPAMPSTSTDTNNVSRYTNVDMRVTASVHRSRNYGDFQNQGSGSGSFRGEKSFNNIFLSHIINSAVTATLNPEHQQMNNILNQPQIAIKGPNHQQNKQKNATTLGARNQTGIVVNKREIAQVANKRPERNLPTHDQEKMQLSRRRVKPLKTVNPVNPLQVARVAPLNETSVIVFNKFAISKPKAGRTINMITGKPIDATKDTITEHGDVIEVIEILSDSDNNDENETQQSISSKNKNIEVEGQADAIGKKPEYGTTILNIGKPINANKSKQQRDVIEILSDSNSAPDLNEVQQCISSENENIEVENIVEEAQAEPMKIHSRTDDSSLDLQIVQSGVTENENKDVEERISVKTCGLIQKSIEPLSEHLSKSVKVGKTKSVDQSMNGVHALENKELENFNSIDTNTNFPNETCDTNNTSEESCKITDNINSSLPNLSAETQKVAHDTSDFEHISILDKLLFTPMYENFKIGLSSSKKLRELSENLSSRLEEILITYKPNELGSTEQQQTETNNFIPCHDQPKKTNESIDGCSQESQVATKPASNDKTEIKIKHSRRLMKKKREPTIPNPPDDNTWTLKHQIQEPISDLSNLTELLPGSDIFVSARDLTYSKAAATSSTDFIQLLMREVFNERALKVCTISDKPRKNGRPRLNRNGVNTLCDYVVYFCGTVDGWDRVDVATVRRIIANRLSRGKSIRVGAKVINSGHVH